MRKFFLLLAISPLAAFTINAQSCIPQIVLTNSEKDCVNKKFIIRGTLTLPDNCNTTFDMSAITSGTYNGTSSFIMTNNSVNDFEFPASQNNSSTTFTVDPNAVNDNILDFETIVYPSATSTNPEMYIYNMTLNLIDLPLKDLTTTSNSHSFDINKLAPAGEISGPATVTINQPATFSFTFDNNNTLYEWGSENETLMISNPTQNSTEIFHEEPGVVILTLVFKKATCYAKYTKEINFISPTTSLNDLTFSGISVVNPAKGKELILSQQADDVQLFTCTGVLLLQEKNISRLALPFPSGLYLLSLNNKLQKLIIE